MPKVLVRTPTSPQILIMTNKAINPQIIKLLPFLRFSSLSGFRKYWIIPHMNPATASVKRRGIIDWTSVQLAQLKILPKVFKSIVWQSFIIYYVVLLISSTVPLIASATTKAPSKRAAPMRV